MIKIKLRGKDGKKKTYTQNWVPVRKMLEAFELTDENYPDIKEFLLKSAEYIADVMGHGLTTDDILDGVATWEWQTFLDEFYAQLNGGIDPEMSPEKE